MKMKMISNNLVIKEITFADYSDGILKRQNTISR